MRWICGFLRANTSIKSAKWILLYTTVYSVHRNHIEWLCGITPAAYKIASTPYYDFTRSYQLRTMTLRGHTNSVPWMHAVCWLRQVTFIQFKQRIIWTNCLHSWYGVGVTAVIHGTELMQFGKMTLRSTKISLKWLWPVKVTLEVIKRRLLVFCWSCDEGPLNWDKKNSRASSLPLRIECVYSRPSPQMVGQCL